VLYEPSEQTRLELTRLHTQVQLVEEVRAKRLADERSQDGYIVFRKMYLIYGVVGLMGFITVFGVSFGSGARTTPITGVREKQLPNEMKLRHEQFQRLQGIWDFKRDPTVTKVTVSKPKSKTRVPANFPRGLMTRPGPGRYKRGPPPKVKQDDIEIYVGEDESTVPFQPHIGPMARPRY